MSTYNEIVMTLYVYNVMYIQYTVSDSVQWYNVDVMHSYTMS